MRKGKWLYFMLMAGLAVVLSLSGPASVSAGSLLPKPHWGKTLEFELYGFPQAPYHVPNTNTVYIHSTSSVQSETKSWEVGVVSAVDKTTGKEKWSYPFYKKGMAYPWSTEIAYSAKGSVYALVEDGRGTKLYSVNSSGKLNWMLPVPEANKLTVMNDGTILLINPSKRDANGKFVPWAYAYGTNGKKLSERALGDQYSVVDGTYLVSQVGGSVKTKIDVYGSKLNKQFTYTPPSNAYIDIAGFSWVYNSSDLLLRMNVPSKGNQLVALNAKGKTLWVRSIAGNATVQSVGKNYVVYENGEMKVYGAKGLLLKKSMKLTDPMQVVHKTIDHKLLINEDEYKSVLDPATLKTIYHLPYDEKTSEYYYAGNGYLYGVKDFYKLSQYILPAVQ